MPSTTSILSTLKIDFPDLRFEKGDTFRWNSAEHVIYYMDSRDSISLLHEVAHAMLGHTEYKRDIELLEIERQAWDYMVSNLAERYNVTVSEESIEDMLDTYRDWLHNRSLCPTCEATGLQTRRNTYMCLACDETWRVNEARNCALRRYRTK